MHSPCANHFSHLMSSSEQASCPALPSSGASHHPHARRHVAALLARATEADVSARPRAMSARAASTHEAPIAHAMVVLGPLGAPLVVHTRMRLPIFAKVARKRALFAHVQLVALAFAFPHPVLAVRRRVRTSALDDHLLARTDGVEDDQARVLADVVACRRTTLTRHAMRARWCGRACAREAWAAGTSPLRFTSSACSVCERKTVCVKDMPGASVRISLTCAPWIQLILTVRVCKLRMTSCICAREAAGWTPKACLGRRGICRTVRRGVPAAATTPSPAKSARPRALSKAAALQGVGRARGIGRASAPAACPGHPSMRRASGPTRRPGARPR